MQQRSIITTADGSATIALPNNITYHSTFGALQESRHIFIQTGLTPLLCSHPTIHIFEMGFGTGLNALLSAAEAMKNRCSIAYTTVEKFPLTQHEVQQFPVPFQDEVLQQLFYQMHQCEWNKASQLHPFFNFKKIEDDLLNIRLPQQFHLIYFDAFDPSFQPELWTVSVFSKLYNALLPDGVLVTYCSKGTVRRDMQAAGFTVTKLKGPPGKREIIRATRS